VRTSSSRAAPWAEYACWQQQRQQQSAVGSAAGFPLAAGPHACSTVLQLPCVRVQGVCVRWLEGCCGVQVQAQVKSALEQGAPLTEAQEGAMRKDVEMYVNSLQNAAFADGLACGTKSAAAKILGHWS
jgi:hypothetical protein